MLITFLLTLSWGRDTITDMLLTWLVGFLSVFFEGSPKHGPASYWFGLAVVLSKGKVVPLVGMFLGSLYLRLDMAATDIIRSFSRYDIATFAFPQFLQAFIYKQFSGLGISSIRCGIVAHRVLHWTFCSLPRHSLSLVIDDWSRFEPHPYAMLGPGYHEGISLLREVVGSCVSAMTFGQASVKIVVTTFHLPAVWEVGYGVMVYLLDRVRL